MKETGYTHVEFKPVMEYLEESTGGYSTSSYYAPTSRFGTPEKFQKAVNLLHQAEVGVILDWTPAQFPRFEEDWKNLTEHLSMKFLMKALLFILCGVLCFIIMEALWCGISL